MEQLAVGMAVLQELRLVKAVAVRVIFVEVLRLQRHLLLRVLPG
jgi:hypothetical protein